MRLWKGIVDDLIGEMICKLSDDSTYWEPGPLNAEFQKQNAQQKGKFRNFND